MSQPVIGDQVRFRDKAAVWQGQIVDIRLACGGGAFKDRGDGFMVQQQRYPEGARIGFVAVLGWPVLHEVDLDRAGFAKKRDGVWRAAPKEGL